MQSGRAAGRRAEKGRSCDLAKGSIFSMNTKPFGIPSCSLLDRCLELGH